MALIEHELLGGECTYWACMPSKALLRPGEALEAVRRVPGARSAAVGEVDIDEALARRDSLASHWDDADQVSWLEGADVDLVRGHGRITGVRQVDVRKSDGSEQQLEATKAVVIATGSAAAMPPIDGLDTAPVWDSRDVTSAKEVPRRLLIIGGGAVGSEMAQAWKWLGAEEVTLVELEDHLLSQEEPFAGKELEGALSRMGIVVHTSASTRSVSRVDAASPATVEVELADGQIVKIETDEILVATGRRPNTDDIGLEVVGLVPGKPVEVDDNLVAKGVPGGWLYAVGDVNARSLLTHTGKYQARIAGRHIAGAATHAWGDTKATPRVVFTSPEVASVGLTERQAREQGFDVRTVSYDIGRVAGASVLGRGYRGTCQLVIDSAREVIVGATFVGPRTGELLHAATIAIVAETPLGTLWHAVPAFPTLSEVWLRLLETYRDQHGSEFD